MGNRTWLAVALCCLVWFVYMRWFVPMPPPLPEVSANPPASAPATPAAPSETLAGALPNTPFATKPQLLESDRLSNPALDVVLSAAGAKIAGIRVNEYTETLKKDSPKIQTVNPSVMPHSLGAFFSDTKLAGLGTEIYSKQNAASGVSFEKSLDGVQVHKTYRPGNGDYFLEEQIDLRFAPSARKDLGFLIVPLGGTGLVSHAEDPLNAWEVVAYQNDSIKRKKLDEIKPGSEIVQGTTRWIAFGNRYFSTAVVNDSSINPDIAFEKNGDFSGIYLRFPLLIKPDQKDLVLKLRVFSGPKEYSELGKVPGMRQLIDYGTFSFLAYPLLECLRFFYRFVHNYGTAIILLTVLVRLLFYPLSLKSFKSMKAMQKLQPQIAALKEKYKDDSQKFGQEQMALFKAHKVNPAGGCLPMLVQLPVFIALYAVLQNSIELFHAPFFGWIRDLSAKDPFYVFPVLMGASMFIQQKMTPAVGMDPTQQKIMLLMPVVFTGIMLSLPSGLTIYIFVSTLLGILQQVMMNREQGKTTRLVAAAPSPTPK